MIFALTFDASPSADVAGYECLAQMLSQEPPRCGAAGCPPERFPVKETCSVSPPSPDGATAGTVRAPAPSPGQILMLAVRAVDRAKNVSDWVGGP